MTHAECKYTHISAKKAETSTSGNLRTQTHTDTNTHTFSFKEKDNNKKTRQTAVQLNTQFLAGCFNHRGAKQTQLSSCTSSHCYTHIETTLTQTHTHARKQYIIALCFLLSIIFPFISHPSFHFLSVQSLPRAAHRHRCQDVLFLAGRL